MTELRLNGILYVASRLRLRKWLQYEQAQVSLHKASEGKQIESYASTLCLLVSSVLDAPLTVVETAPWYEVLGAYGAIVELNRVREIPLTRPHPTKSTAVPWEYAGREWYWWLHTFAKNYGWSAAQVEELDIDDAISLLQEILVDEQIDREFAWSLSELAYPYNETTKKHVFKPMERPEWMRDRPTVVLPAMKIKFPKSMLPVGRIIGEDEHERLVS